MKQFNNYAPSLMLVVFLLLVWEIYTGSGLMSPVLLPRPSLVITRLIENWDIIKHHALQTALEALIGFTLAVVIGAAAALLLDASNIMRRILYPLIIGSQTVPLIVLAPLFLVWFGFGIVPKIIIVFLFCFFPITLATAGGLAGVDKDRLRLFLSMNASRWQIIKYLKFPSALPSFFAGAKIASAYSVTGAIVGEFVGSERGLGIYMKLMANSKAVANLFAGVLVSIILSFVFFIAVLIIEKASTPWSQRK